MKITISEIKVNPGRRPVNLEGINELARSISAIGLLNPITIDQEHTLVAGLHRLEAAKRLGWTEIECNICTLDALQTELAEIDENVVRTELSVIEYGELLERQKEIYESLHPETKAGQAQAAGMPLAHFKTLVGGAGLLHPLLGIVILILHKRIDDRTLPDARNSG